MFITHGQDQYPDFVDTPPKQHLLDTGNLACVITVRTYIVVVFENEPLSAGVTQLYARRLLAMD